jgi:heptosyltransferase-2
MCSADLLFCSFAALLLSLSLRLLIVLPSWVGDAVMATPALRLLREGMPGAFIGGLARPGIDEVLAGTPFLDEVHVERASGVMGPKRVAATLRPRRYDAALLLSNSFSSALTTRLAFIPRRIGYARDGRSLLLTERLAALTRADGRWAPVSAVTYYWNAACAVLPGASAAPWDALPAAGRLTLAVRPEDERAADELLARAGVPVGRMAVLNPGGNNPAKRWPPDRFSTLAAYLREKHRMTVLVSGSPGEADLADRIAAAAGEGCHALPRHALGLGALKAIVRRSALMVTTDTGPRHFAAAFDVPLATLFGPTDPRWTTIPAPAGEERVVADPTLPPEEVADDHPDRCRIERITLDRVRDAVDRLLGSSRPV